jgi:2-isopropylmalate synthase
VPYLPIDPADLGRNYDAVIRVNSQSGKGGIAWLLEQEYGLALPRRLQIEFSRAVQQATDSSGREVDAAAIHAIFRREYLDVEQHYAYHGHAMSSNSGDEGTRLSVDIGIDGVRATRHGTGNGPIDAFVNALGLDVKVMDYQEHAIGSGADAQAACYVELRVGGGGSLFGVGVAGSIMTASFKAILSGVNRHVVAARASGEQVAA